MENVANTMHKIADQSNAEREQNIKALHEEYVEKAILPYIKEVATNGRYFLPYSLERRYSTDRIAEILTAHGFVVEKGAQKFITISW